MARPKKTDRDGMAIVRIEDAFWKLLEEMSYSEITVLRISQESGTNRNSFYYHYRDINDLAYKAFINNADNEVSKTLVSALMSAFREGHSAPVFDMSVLPHTKRIMLCAGSDSPFLNQLVNDLLKTIWFDSMSIKEELLSEDEKIQVSFIFAGLVSVLGSQEIKHNPLYMSTLSQTELGAAIITTLKNMASRQQKISDNRS